MNVFCYPRVCHRTALARLLGIDPAATPAFGVKAQVPLANGRGDRTEVDMRLGDLLVEAKLTESDFQSAPAVRVERYRDLAAVFAVQDLPRVEGRYLSYQLLRNILAAHASGSRFCLRLDARRPDLVAAYARVAACVRHQALRTRCQLLTWQELAGALPARLQTFLAAKYGIAAVR